MVQSIRGVGEQLVLDLPAAPPSGPPASDVRGDEAVATAVTETDLRAGSDRRLGGSTE